MRINRILLVNVLTVLMAAARALASDHPGNVHTLGEDVRVAVPATWSAWRAIDVDKKEVGRGVARDCVAELGKLPVGYFEVLQDGGDGKVTAGVVAKTA